MELVTLKGILKVLSVISQIIMQENYHINTHFLILERLQHRYKKKKRFIVTENVTLTVVFLLSTSYDLLDLPP